MVRSDSPVRSHAASAPTLLKRHLRKAPELAAVHLLGAKFAQDFYSAHANAQMLIDAITVELVPAVLVSMECSVADGIHSAGWPIHTRISVTSDCQMKASTGGANNQIYSKRAFSPLSTP
jgi:hypothetical protein